MRAGERTDFLAPRPEQPNSIVTLFTVTLGTIAGHIIGAGYFVLQSQWCARGLWHISVNFDPSPYQALFVSPRKDVTSDLGVECWFLSLLLMGVLTGWLAERASKSSAFKGTFDRIDFGWLYPAAQAVKKGNSLIVGYVVTKMSHDASTVAYEGIVDRVALDDNQAVAMIVLRNVDRFTVRIEEDGSIKRYGGDMKPIPQMQFVAAEIANVVLEIITVPEMYRMMSWLHNK